MNNCELCNKEVEYMLHYDKKTKAFICLKCKEDPDKETKWLIENVKQA